MNTQSIAVQRPKKSEGAKHQQAGADLARIKAVHRKAANLTLGDRWFTNP
jgi:hypothetical protein